ncbi:MAG: NAD(P)H-hydrate dehydratase [Methylococcales bacterium]|nr:NAD(P)H-hydrate dehydratase [Methylococcales bacterium]
MKSLYSVATSRAIDAWIINQGLYSGYALMQRAGEALFQHWLQAFPQRRCGIILVGPGNNGGDGLVVARLAKAEGFRIQVYSLVTKDAYRGDARLALQDWLAVGGTLTPFHAQLKRPGQPCLLVDALFGSGLNKALTGLAADAVNWLNRQNSPVLAVDLPSGVQGDSGAILGTAVNATHTVCLIAPKPGLYTGAARACVGRRIFTDLALPSKVYQSFTACAEVIQPPYFSRRPAHCHKGRNGHVWVLGGAPGFSGAARMTGEAALRVGAGRVSIATHKDHAAVLNVNRPELMVHGFNPPAALAELAQGADVLALGPGLGRGEFGRYSFAQALAMNLPTVVDADALNLLAEAPERRTDWILTPHPGEAARLLNSTVAEIEADRYQAASALQQRYGGVVVLKGAGTIIADGQQLFVVDTGNPGMATAGMGDILTGVIAGLWAQGLSALDSAKTGAYVHGAAGDQAASDGERGLIATDLLPLLRQWVNVEAADAD